MNKLKDDEYYNNIQREVVQVIETRSIDDFARNLQLTSGEAWEVYRQIKDMVVDAEILYNITKISDSTHNVETILNNETRDLRTAIDDQLKEEVRLHEIIEDKLYQSHGLKWLAPDYFETHKTTKKDFERWSDGFGFELESIKDGQELRRSTLLSHISGVLEKQHRLLMVGESATSKIRYIINHISYYA